MRANGKLDYARARRRRARLRRPGQARSRRRSCRSAAAPRERLPPSRGKGNIFKVFHFLSALEADGHDRAVARARVVRAPDQAARPRRRRSATSTIRPATRRGSTCCATTASSRPCCRSGRRPRRDPSCAATSSSSTSRPARRARSPSPSGCWPRSRASTPSTATQLESFCAGARHALLPRRHRRAVRRAGAAHLPRGRLSCRDLRRRAAVARRAGARRRRRGAGRALPPQAAAAPRRGAVRRAVAARAVARRESTALWQQLRRLISLLVQLVAARAAPVRASSIRGCRRRTHGRIDRHRRRHLGVDAGDRRRRRPDAAARRPRTRRAAWCAAWAATTWR